MVKPKAKPKANRDSNKHVSREYVHSLRGKFKGKGLLKALLAEKRHERVSGKMQTPPPKHLAAAKPRSSRRKIVDPSV